MNYTETEAKVREATNDDAWGPTGKFSDNSVIISDNTDMICDNIDMISGNTDLQRKILYFLHELIYMIYIIYFILN